jgi:hypothetical protein
MTTPSSNEPLQQNTIVSEAKKVEAPHERELVLLDNDKWLDAFYRECGREITLAYTTLNQMKNWAMVVAAAAISGLSFSSSAQQNQYPNIPMFVGTVVVYVFVLRFYIRAILCYTNLLKWNKLQSDCLSLKLMQPARNKMSLDDLKKRLTEDINLHYYEFLPTVGRKTQLLANLKLGFILLFALTIFFLIWGIAGLWSSHLVRGLTVFAIGNSALEMYDFFTSRNFDDVNAWKSRRAKGKEYGIFPVPQTRALFIYGWIINIAVSLVVATWPAFRLKIISLLCR